MERDGIVLYRLNGRKSLSFSISGPHIDVLVRPEDPATTAAVTDIDVTRSRGLSDFAPAALAALLAELIRRRFGSGWLPIAWAVLLAVSAVTAGAALDPAARLAWSQQAREHLQIAALAAIVLLTIRETPRALRLAGLALAVAWLHWPALGYGLLADDYVWAKSWTVADTAAVWAGATDPTGLSNTHYRPVTTTAHAIDAFVWGFSPMAWHATNLVLLAAVAMALAIFLELCVGAVAPAQLAALLYVAHPWTAAIAGWISERTDGLAAGAYLGTLAASLAGWPIWAIAVLGAAAMGAKEAAVTLPATTAAVLLARGRPLWRPVACLAGLALALVVLWTALFPEKAAGSVGATYLRQNAAQMPAHYGALAAPPAYERWLRRRDLRAPVGYVVFAAVPLVWVLLRRKRPELARMWVFGCAWPALTLPPMWAIANLDVYRLGAIPAVGAALAVASLAAVVRHPRVVALVGLAGVAYLAPLAVDARESWGPGGPQAGRLLGWGIGVGSGTDPRALEHYREQLGLQLHLEGIRLEGKPDAPFDRDAGPQPTTPKRRRSLGPPRPSSPDPL